MVNDLTVSKTYIDIPIAHRLHLHDGRCKYVHGHNFRFDLTMACKQLDENGFVVDFGKLQCLKTYFDTYDHSIIISTEDTEFDEVLTKYPQFFRIHRLPITSVEGMASHMFYEINSILQREFYQRVYLISITIYEDSKNFTTYCPSF